MYSTERALNALLLTAFVFIGATAAAAAPANVINLPSSNVIFDDDTPEVTARVARISFISGGARIRRADSDDWESATLNLPVVEGDEIVTDSGAKVEIQLAKDQHLRLSENSFLKFVSLKDEGIAVSLSLGSMHLNVLSFDKDKAFFEIDAPKTTIAIQSAGAYRIDAGEQGNTEVRVTTTAGGEARVYSDLAGFTLRNGRTARLFIDGPQQGEWDTTAAAASTDSFGRWAFDRDEMIAGRLNDAYYGQYYDNDIYGADDLNGHGQWIHTRDYGYVWRPSASAIGRYSDWSPYRYGHWRWLPPFGWTWVNDEPWGWATYHHGRWFYHDGYWNWSPYGYYRTSRSWWRPALVVITIVRNSICWYPLNYHQAHYNYNRHRGRDRDRDRDRDRRPPRGGDDRGRDNNAGPIRGQESAGIMGRVKGGNRVPPNGVVGVDAKEFGTGVRGVRRMPREVIDAVLDPKTTDKLPELPKRETLSRGMGREILAERPKGDLTGAQARVGAAKRKPDAPLDSELRNTRVFGGRPPVRQTTDGDGGSVRQPRPTGIFDRPVQTSPPRVRPGTDTPPRSVEPIGTPPSPKESPRFEPPVERENIRRTPPQPKESPRTEPPSTRENIRRMPPQPRESPGKESPPARERPRETPPVKVTPKNDPPAKPKSDPPAKESPKPDRSPAPSRKADPID